jgi:hypothetical protein
MRCGAFFAKPLVAILACLSSPLSRLYSLSAAVSLLSFHTGNKVFHVLLHTSSTVLLRVLETCAIGEKYCFATDERLPGGRRIHSCSKRETGPGVPAPFPVFRILHKNGFEPIRKKTRFFPSKKPESALKSPIPELRDFKDENVQNSFGTSLNFAN